MAAQLALLGAIDTLLSALLADSLTKSHHDSNRELIGQGIGNIGAALVGGLPGAGANIRTIVNIEAGGKTRLSGVMHGLFLLAVLLGLSGLVSYIPNAVLAGILVGAGLGCIDFRGLSHIAKVPRSDAAVLVIVLALTVFAGLIAAVAVGLVISSFVFMKKVADNCERQTAISPLADEPWADEIDIPADLRHRLLIKHVEGPLFFGFARGFLNIAASAASGRLLVLRMDRVSLMDQSGAYALQDALVNLASSGVRVVLVQTTVAQRDILAPDRLRGPAGRMAGPSGRDGGAQLAHTAVHARCVARIIKLAPRHAALLDGLPATRRRGARIGACPGPGGGCGQCPEVLAGAGVLISSRLGRSPTRACCPSRWFTSSRRESLLR